MIGLDLGPSTIAIVSHHNEAKLVPLCEELRTDERAKQRLERKIDRERRANNPQNYDEKGRIKIHGKQRLIWKDSNGYLATRRRLAHLEHRLAAHRKSLHGRLVHEIICRGNNIRIEKISYRAWQKQFGRCVGLRAPGMLIDHLRRTGAAHRRHPKRVSHAHYQAFPVLPWLQELCQKTAFPTLARVHLWRWPGPT